MVKNERKWSFMLFNTPFSSILIGTELNRPFIYTVKSCISLDIPSVSSVTTSKSSFDSSLLNFKNSFSLFADELSIIID